MPGSMDDRDGVQMVFGLYNEWLFGSDPSVKRKTTRRQRIGELSFPSRVPIVGPPALTSDG